MKGKVLATENIDKLFEGLKNLPIKNRLRIDIHMGGIDLITHCGFREDKVWTDDEDELSLKLSQATNKITSQVLETIKEWEADGRPE